jgi:glycosyltransferase involved in cell wall biosynthesis
VNFPEFYQLIQSARFIISPTLEQSSCFGGVSFLDLARTVRKPIITTDLAVIREAIGAHNAILLPVGDDEALFAAIERCATDDSYVDQLAAEFEELSHANRSRWLADYVVQLAKGWR